MKTLLLFSMALMSFKTFGLSIAPEKTVTPLIALYSSSNKKISETEMEVRVSTYNNRGDISRARGKMKMPMKHYLRAREQAGAVYSMNPKADSNSDGFYMGTAFHIGNNLVLTNQHVLSPDRSNSSECGGFQLQDSLTKDTYPCQKVHYCNVEQDVCLIEMGAARKCHNFFCTKSSLIEMKDGPSLKLKAMPVMTYENMNNAVMTCIGNTMGYGIHYSQGKSFRKSADRIYFFAPLRSGNSGGPLIGEDGLVWGVVKLESALTVGADAYNVAVSADKVIELMQEQLADDPQTLANFNQAIK